MALIVCLAVKMEIGPSTILGDYLSALEDRFLAKVEITEGCWWWRGGIVPNGYGMISVANRGRMAHRLAYELFVGPIPTGKVIDHLCRQWARDAR